MKTGIYRYEPGIKKKKKSFKDKPLKAQIWGWTGDSTVYKNQRVTDGDQHCVLRSGRAPHKLLTGALRPGSSYQGEMETTKAEGRTRATELITVTTGGVGCGKGRSVGGEGETGRGRLTKALADQKIFRFLEKQNTVTDPESDVLTIWVSVFLICEMWIILHNTNNKFFKKDNLFLTVSCCSRFSICCSY